MDTLKSEHRSIANLIATNQFDAARARLEEYLAEHPDDGQAVFLLGLTFHREKKYAQALPHFDRALTLPPRFAPIEYFRGWACYYLGDVEESQKAFHAFLVDKPDSPDPHFALGRIAQDRGDLDEAQTQFQRAIQLLSAPGAHADPHEMAKAHARLAEVLEQRGDLQQAKLNLIISIKLFPDHHEALYKLYRIHMRLGETADAEAAHAQYVAVKQRMRPGAGFPE